MHFGIMGQKWGIRRYQNPDGTLTPEGRARYQNSDGTLTKEGEKHISKYFDARYRNSTNDKNRRVVEDKIVRGSKASSVVKFSSKQPKCLVYV